MVGEGGAREAAEAAREEEEETEWKRLMASDTVVIKRQSGGGETAENSNRLDVDEHEMSRETLFLSFGNANTSGCLFFFFHAPFSNQNISQPTRFQVESLENKRKKTVNQYRFSIFSNELNDRFVSKLKDSQKKMESISTYLYLLYRIDYCAVYYRL